MIKVNQLVSFLWLCTTAVATGLSFEISVSEGLLNSSSDGRVLLLLAPAGVDPAEDTDVTTSPDLFFGYNVNGVVSGDTISLQAGSDVQPLINVYGFPNVSLDEVASGDYTVQAYLNVYETVTRSDGSTVFMRFPCGDGGLPFGGPGSLYSEPTNFTITGSTQTVQLTFDNITAPEDFTGSEIGGCSQGNYEDWEQIRYVKIRSDVLSEFWGRDTYVGANVLLPAGYDESDATTRYPVIYHQGHWPADGGLYGYGPSATRPADLEFIDAWNNGTITNTTDPAPKLIIVTFRHETPYYDDSYAVNTANIGPYGDAINDELIPYIDAHFNTIAAPYGRVQDGGSTGGWESAANLIFRPDLFGVCFSSYPDSLNFNRHQDIHLYTAKNAYTLENGTAVYSIRENINDTLVDVTTVAQENHWELSQGTNSRSNLQWDVWNAVFGVQGINSYPLEPWDKVTGEIYPEAVEYWRTMDLANWVVSNWDNSLNLGEVLAGRIFIYVGSWDNYFLNEGVMAFQEAVDAKGGQGWANVTILQGQPHGGNYQRRPTWDYLQLVADWVKAHAPDGETPLAANVTLPSSRGNLWADVLAQGGHQAALARQASPELEASGGSINASVGRWDPGVTLEAQWVVNGSPSGAAFAVAQNQTLTYGAWSGGQGSSLQLQVTGTKRGYVDETRSSNTVTL